MKRSPIVNPERRKGEVSLEELSDLIGKLSAEVSSSWTSVEKAMKKLIGTEKEYRYKSDYALASPPLEEEEDEEITPYEKARRGLRGHLPPGSAPPIQRAP